MSDKSIFYIFFFSFVNKMRKKERKTYIWYPLILYLVYFWKEMGIVSSESKCKNLLKLHAMGLGILVAVIKNIDFIAIYRGTHIFNCVDNAIYISCVPIGKRFRSAESVCSAWGTVPA